jgi:hypothetical protein
MINFEAEMAEVVKARLSKPKPSTTKEWLNERVSPVYTWALAIGIVGGLGLAILNVAGSSTTQQSAASAAYSSLPERLPLHLRFDWTKGGFGAVMMADFTITNNSNVDVKDIEITCTHRANSGTVIDSNKRTIYERVSAGRYRIVRNFNMGFIHGQAQKSSCEITDYKRAS